MVHLQKAFDIVDHGILLGKLEHYGIRRITNKWFETYFNDKQQFFSINSYNSECASMPTGVRRGSVLGPLLFLFYINDVNLAIKYCNFHHFADDTNLLYTNNSIKKLSKILNKDLKNLTTWLNANRISLNFDKTEMILFKPIKKTLDCQLKLKLNGKDFTKLHQLNILELKLINMLTGRII